jgi:hypothetical protein
VRSCKLVKRKERGSQSGPNHQQSTDTPPPGADRPDLSGIRNPWEYLEKVRVIPRQYRGSYTNEYLKLCSEFPPLESDALVKAGAEVFGYRLAAGYETVRKFREDKELLPARAATVIAEDEGWIAEMVLDVLRPDQALGYLVHRFVQPDVQPKFEPSVTYQKRVYSPAWMTILDRVLFVPSGIEEYDTDQALFEAIDAYLQRYVYIPDLKYRRIAAIYVLMTWVYDRFSAIPYLRAIGQFSSGKSRFLEVVGSICYRPLFGSGASSPASLYRAISVFNGPTLVLDEADFAQTAEAHEITKILNQGYQKRGGVMKAERSEDGESFEVTVYPTYGPKVLATRGPFEDPALESRCFNYHMPVLTEIPREIPISLDRQFDESARRLRNRLLLWRFRNYQSVTVDAWARIEGVTEGRIHQIVQPIIACTVDPVLRTTITEVAQRYSQEMRRQRQESLEGMIADVLLRRWELQNRPDRLALQGLLDTFCEETRLKMHPRRFSGILRGVLDLPVRRVGGYSHVVTLPATMARLEVTYGMSDPEPEPEPARAAAPPPGSQNGPGPGSARRRAKTLGEDLLKDLQG